MSDGVVVNQKPPKGGAFGKFFCSAPHPTDDSVWCRRLPEHPGRCAAFVHSISEAEEW